MCVFDRAEDRTNFELEEVISMQLRSKIAVARNIRIHHHSLLNAKHKTVQLFLVQRLRTEWYLQNNTQTTGKAIQLHLHGIPFLSEHLDLLKHRATTSAGKPMSILRVIAEKISPFLSCLDCYMIFSPTRHECVIIFIKCFCPTSLCFILFLVLIF